MSNLPSLSDSSKSESATNDPPRNESSRDQPNVSVADMKRANRRSAFMWGGFVVAFLVLQLVLGFSALVLSTADPTVAVVPEYYQKSLDWDAKKELKRQALELGWKVDIAAVDGKDLKITLRDSNDEGVEISNASVAVYRHARAADVITKPLAENEIQNGCLSIAGILTHTGLWQVDLDATDRSGKRYIHSQTIRVRDQGDDS